MSLAPDKGSTFTNGSSNSGRSFVVKPSLKKKLRKSIVEFWKNLTNDCPPPRPGASHSVLAVHSIVTSSGFQVFMLLCVILQAITAALDAPILLQPTLHNPSGLPSFNNSGRNYTFFVVGGAVDLIVTAIFLIEVTLKLVAFSPKVFFQ